VWAFPEVLAKKAATDKVLDLCREFPLRSHHALATEAKARWAMSRAAYYRHLEGRSCAHTQAAGISPTDVSGPGILNGAGTSET
jgi:hypothetical protein